ncbi:PGF-CTERM sorting domain-containing protein [Halobacterium litoreum]|uniref:PGF-CTERM sorting domain-containing protein n=1 Tax=Halobacterium litoreum TaxID=2039234 RepID=A0ABD5NFD4_9EURY|nr:PGF-CTERM sorting domain-containing protein [Halobacterium litoreum]UHH13493.1 PGF-CTERM sorting domain-containing protein [Halobacterium litoreum]
MPSTRPGRRALTLLVALCVCASAATAATAAASPTRTNGAVNGCFPGVDSVERDEAVGDAVELEMLLCFEGSVAVDGPGYTGNVTLGDGEKSGTVTLELDTDANDSAAFGVTSDSLDDVPMNATGDGAFEPGNYTVTVRDGSGDVADTVTFELDAPTARDVTLWRAPLGADADLRTLAAVRESRATASQVDSRRRLDDYDSDSLAVATNETLVVALRADGIEGAMTGADGDARTRFRTALRETGGDFALVQTPESTPPSRQPLTPPVLNNTETRVLPDHANDTYYLVVDTRDLRGEWGGTHGGTIHVGSRDGMGFAARLSLQGSGADGDWPADTVAADFELVAATVSTPATAGDRTALTPTANAGLVARTTLAAGTEVTVRVSGAANRTVDATVRARNGSANVVVAPLDLSDVPDGATLSVAFERGGTRLDESRLTAVVAAPTATLHVEPDEDELWVHLSDATHPTVVATTAANGTVLDTRSVSPEATNDSTVTLSVTAGADASAVRLYHDADHSGTLTDADERYRRHAVERETTTPTTTETTDEPTESTPTTSRTTDTQTPGFGVLGALLALLVGVGLRRR